MNKLQRELGIGALILSGAALLLTGIEVLELTKPIDSGQIINKRYEPQRTYSKKARISDDLPYINRYSIDDEDYIIEFEKMDGKKFRKRTVYVTKEVYDSLNVGDVLDTSKLSYESSDPDQIMYFNSPH